MGGADQPFGVGARLAFEAAGKAVWVFVERAAFRRDGALPSLMPPSQTAVPNVIISDLSSGFRKGHFDGH